MEFIKQKERVQLPARNNVFETSIYTESYTQSGHLGHRDVVLFVPGGPGNDHTTCDTQSFSFAESLVPIVDVIMFDPRGCGESEPSPIDQCTLEHYIQDIEAIRNHYKISKNQLILVGASYGAIAALGYAIQYSAMVHKLILICGSASGEFLRDARHNLMTIGTPEQQIMGKKILTGTFALSQDTVAAYYEIMGPLYSISFKPGMPTPSIVFNIALANLGFSQFLKTFDYRPKLSEVTCQTLIMSGDDDWISDKKQAKTLHHGITKSTLVEYPNCGHMIWIDQWDWFLQDLIQFIQ